MLNVVEAAAVGLSRVLLSPLLKFLDASVSSSSSVGFRLDLVFSSAEVGLD